MHESDAKWNTKISLITVYESWIISRSNETAYRQVALFLSKNSLCLDLIIISNEKKMFNVLGNV